MAALATVFTSGIWLALTWSLVILMFIITSKASPVVTSVRAPVNPVMIQAVHSDKCLDVLGAGQDDFVNLIQYSCHGGPNQRFRFVPAGSDTYTIRAVHSDKCLDVLGASQDDGVNLVQYSCHGGPNQRFRLLPTATPDAFAIQAVHSDKCLDVLGAGQDDFVNLIQHAYHGGPNQRFRFLE